MTKSELIKARCTVEQKKKKKKKKKKKGQKKKKKNIKKNSCTKISIEVYQKQLELL